MNSRNYILISLVLLWMGLIFFLSSMNGSKSNKESSKIIKYGFEKTIETTNTVKITNVNPKAKSEELSNKFNYPLRKVAHATEYGILGILIILLLKNNNIKYKYYLSILFTFLYSISDELHQRYTGRTSQFRDVLIDTLGCVIFLSIFYIIEKKRLNKNEEV